MGSNKLSRYESIFLWAAGTAACVLRAVLLFRYRFDSDEPQHMHVAWAWSHGLMQYRDVFDNHMPLFHILWAPLFRIAGDDVNVLYLARLSVVPLFVASIYLVFRIAERLFDRTAAIWAAALTAVFPPFFLGMLEYRTDDLWVVMWLACILVLLSDAAPLRRAVAGGAFLGLAFGVSMKSVLFAIALVVAAFATTRLMRGRSAEPGAGEVGARLTTLLSTALIVPTTIGALFAMAGAWDQFAYCVLWHNTSSPIDHMWWRVFWIVPFAPLALHIARKYADSDDDLLLVRRRLFLFLLCATYFIVLSAFWPILALETYLPFYPLAAILIAPVALRVRRIQGVPAFAMTVVVLLIGTTAVAGKIWRDEAHEEVALIRQVLQITRPGDSVMDLKGESLFRQRPYWLVLESITHRKLRNHDLRDDIAAALVRSGTAVLASTDFPVKTRAFVRRNYVPWGRLWVVGHRVLPAPPGGAIPFRIAVPSRYVIVDAHGRVDATIDGVPAGDGISLTRGRHFVSMARQTTGPMVIWAGVLRSQTFLRRLRETEELMKSDGTARRMAASIPALQNEQ